MDNRLKERLVGATVLVVLAVIFIPMLLDGPGSSRRIRQSVDLPPADERTAESATDRKTVRIDLRDSSIDESGRESEQSPATANDEPVEVDLTAGQDQDNRPESGGVLAESSPQPTETKPVQQQPAATEAPASATPEVVTPAQQRPEGAWTVQVGSFGNSDNADALAERLKTMDYEAFVSRYDDGSRTHFRVRVGGYATREAAADKAEEIKRRTGEPARPAKND